MANDAMMAMVMMAMMASDGDDGSDGKLLAPTAGIDIAEIGKR